MADEEGDEYDDAGDDFAQYDGVFAGDGDGEGDDGDDGYDDAFEGAEPAVPDPRTEEGDAADDGYERPGPARGRRPSDGTGGTQGRPMSRQSPPGSRDAGFEEDRVSQRLHHQLEEARAEGDALREALDRLRATDADRRASRVARHEFSSKQLQDEIYDLSTKLVEAGEKNAKLGEAVKRTAAERDALKADQTEARKVLIGKITHGASSREKRDPLEAYANVTVAQLLDLRERAMEAELRGRSHLLASGGATRRAANQARASAEEKANAAPAPSNPGDAAAVAAAVRGLEEEIAKLRGRLRHAEDEKSGLRQELRGALAAGDDVRALKHKATELLGRGKAEKDSRARAEAELKTSTKKVAALGDHVEKLMVHLKHEVGAKAQVADQLKRTERDLEGAKLRSTTLAKRNNAREKFVLELKEGSKILEDQLRLMDRRYLELRAKLDWTRHHADRQVKKAKAAASTLRAKWALATNSQQGLLDNVTLPETLPTGASQMSAFSPMPPPQSAASVSSNPETLDEPGRKQTRFAVAGKR